MAKEFSEMLESDMDSFISCYLKGNFGNFLSKDADENDIFDLYCKLGKVFDIFCEKLEKKRNTI